MVMDDRAGRRTDVLNDNLLIIERGLATVVNERVSQVDYAPWIVWKRWVDLSNTFFEQLLCSSPSLTRDGKIRVLSVRIPKSEVRTANSGQGTRGEMNKRVPTKCTN